MPELKIHFKKDKSEAANKFNVTFELSEVQSTEIDFAVKLLNLLKTTLTNSEFVHDFMKETP